MTVPNFSSTRILVVGDVMLDTYWQGPVFRISPEAPVPVVRVERVEPRLGGAGNVALNSSVLGANTQLLGLVGDDPMADQVELMLCNQQVKCQLQRVSGSKTINKLRILSRNQQLIRLDFEDNFPNWDEHLLERNLDTMLPESDVVILSDYSKGVLRNPLPIIASSRAQNKPVIVDPKGSDFSRYKGATIVTPNLSEFEAVVGTCDSDTDMQQRAIRLINLLELDALLITLSERGMLLITLNDPPFYLPARSQEVFDVTGAGDTVVATLGACIGAGLSLSEAVSLSNLAAGIVVSKLGTSTVSPSELKLALHDVSTGSQSCIFEKDILLSKISLSRSLGERIVMTNGCFDILHPGHVDYLEKARDLGDRLIVAVNDDTSVKRLKGPSRPINSLATRMRVLSSLKCVDWVLSFCEDTPKQLYEQILPDVLVKGGDYTVDQVVGADCVRAAGGEVKIINFLPGHSTSNLIKRIQDSSL